MNKSHNRRVKSIKWLACCFIVWLVGIPVTGRSQTPGKFKLAIIQMYVEPGDKEKNLAHAEELIKEAKANGADFALLPEMMDLGWTHPSAKKLAGQVPGGETCSRLCNAARKNNMYICCGIAERADGQVYNAAVVIDNFGKVLLKHRKLNELDIAHDVYAQGDCLGVCHTPYGTLGLMICADAFAKSNALAQALCYMGADVILSPSSWAVRPGFDNQATPYGKEWREAYKPVAREYSVWIAAVSNVGPVTEGPWKGWKCIGCSMVVGPDGQERITGPFGENAEKILYCLVNPLPRPARGTQWYNYKPKN